MTHTERIEFDATLPGYDEDVCIGFDRTTEWSTDHSYGSDADGRRGISVTDIDVDDYAHITVDGVPCLTLDAMHAVEAYMQSHEPEMPEESEGDYDDVGD